LANVINVGRAAVDAEGASDKSTWGGRQKRVVPMHRCWLQAGGEIDRRRWKKRPPRRARH